MKSTEPHASHPLEYAPPPAVQPDELRHAGMLVSYLCISMAVLSAYSYFGIRWGQRKENSTVLFAPATGTDFYDHMFIDLPFWAFTAACVVIGVWVLINVVRRRWVVWWLPIAIFILPLSWLGWVVAMIVSLWDDVSP